MNCGHDAVCYLLFSEMQKENTNLVSREPELHAWTMRMALREAQTAFEQGEVPVGAIIMHHGELIAKAHNQTELLKDPTAHAEMLAITQATSALGDWRLQDCTLYVTKEPCPMCAGAIILARLPLVVWGVDDPKRGGASSVFNILQHPQLNHRSEIIRGVLEDESRILLQRFFRERRNQQTER
ncbi:MAG: tRNA adenosine(34) deaminase TadA [Kiritimatiellae bacterium]|nr:tRNA adenosine(34) deaminase TadA [Kiritimatiellia bacterium]MDD4734530.1 tRNA adenosine(34) deaminase TadA [Kiritimatiellia bacterium]